MSFSIQKVDSAQIISLWRTCFGDSESFIQKFLNERCEPHCEVVYRVDNQIVSMLFLLSTELVVSEKIHPVYYVYACATHPKFRQQGLMQHLLKIAERKTKTDNKSAMFLVPASYDLFNFYRRCGFDDFSKINFQIIPKEKIKNGHPFKMKGISNKQMLEIRNQKLSKTDFIKWNLCNVNFIANDIMDENGELIGFTTDSGDGYALCQHDEHRLIKIIEWISPDDAHFDNVLTTLHLHFQADYYAVYSPSKNNSGRLLSMIKPVVDDFPKTKDIYLNLVGM